MIVQAKANCGCGWKIVASEAHVVYNAAVEHAKTMTHRVEFRGTVKPEPTPEAVTRADVVVDIRAS